MVHKVKITVAQSFDFPLAASTDVNGRSCKYRDYNLVDWCEFEFIVGKWYRGIRIEDATNDSWFNCFSFGLILFLYLIYFFCLYSYPISRGKSQARIREMAEENKREKFRSRSNAPLIPRINGHRAFQLLATQKNITLTSRLRAVRSTLRLPTVHVNTKHLEVWKDFKTIINYSGVLKVKNIHTHIHTHTKQEFVCYSARVQNVMSIWTAFSSLRQQTLNGFFSLSSLE